MLLYKGSGARKRFVAQEGFLLGARRAQYGESRPLEANGEAASGQPPMGRKRIEQTEALPANLRRLMSSSRGLTTQLALEKESGVAQSTIGRILRGQNCPRTRTLTALAKALDTTTSDLLQVGTAGDVTGATAEPGRVPLISWAQVGAAVSSGISRSQPAEAESWLPCPKQCGARTYALRVGKSMEPYYETGDIIYVDPDVTARHGNDVVVRLVYSIQFKRFVVEGQRRYLKSLNPRWPEKMTPLAADACIAGVVIGRWSDR